MVYKKVLGSVLLGSVGLFFLVYSASIPVELPGGIYVLEISTSPTNPDLKLNSFLWKHNFETNEGQINFTLTSDAAVDHVLLDFPIFLNEDKYSAICTTHDSTVKNIFTDLKGSDDPSRHSVLILYNVSNCKSINVSYDLALVPSGAFILSHPQVDLYDYKYGINFVLGPNYFCSDCLKIEKSNGVKSYVGSSNKDIKLVLDTAIESCILDNCRKWHLVKLESQNTSFCKDFCFGIGVSLISAAIVWLFEIFVKNGAFGGDGKHTRNKSKKKKLK
ncbi:MAG: hypothetical protein JW727_03810 [Candidatus Aenigmarchaeota archaeon]|nr:hypothetical protein [Candidatus Aenigmarchaeota archaeon]